MLTRGTWIAIGNDVTKSVLSGLVLGICLSAFGFSVPVQAQTLPEFTIPQWKSEDGQAIIRLRARAAHDFYAIDIDGLGNLSETHLNKDDLRALRVGVDGQLSLKVRIRADANLTNSQINWSDIYIGYVGTKFEAFLGQQFLASTLESVSRPVTSLLPEPSLVTLAFGQNQRNFGAMARMKGKDWQIVGGLYHGNVNAGDIFGDDVLRYAQLRASFAPKHTERDVVHLGVNLRLRDVQNGPLLRYATRPAGTSFGPRTLDSGPVATSDTTLAFEAIIMRGPLVIIGEHHFLWAKTPTGDVSLAGTYLEVAWWITGEGRRYQVGAGNLNQIRPKRSIRQGGPGAIALVARFDSIDQTDVRLSSRAGRVTSMSFGVSWMPVDYVTLRLSASQSDYSGTISSRNGSANVVTGRVQFAF